MTPDERREYIADLPPNLRDVALHLLETTRTAVHSKHGEERPLFGEMDRDEMSFAIGFTTGLMAAWEDAERH